MLDNITGTDDISEQIEDLSKFTGLNEYVIEKDLYITKSIALLPRPHMICMT